MLRCSEGSLLEFEQKFLISKQSHILIKPGEKLKIPPSDTGPGGSGDVPVIPKLSPGMMGGLDDVRRGEDLGNRRYDPLTLDLDGDGVELISVNNSKAFFDLDIVQKVDGSYSSDGVKEQVGWVKGDDGLVVLDKNNNGKAANQPFYSTFR